jgi:hypothetical protein
VSRNGRIGIALLAAGIAATMALASPAWADSNKQIARASTLTISDFPAGWTESPHTESAPSKLPACGPTVAAAKRAKPFGAWSPDFGLSSGTTQTSAVTNVVYVFPSVKQARAYLAAFQLPTAERCLQARLDRSTRGSSVKATVAPLDVSGSPADDEVGLTATLASSLDTVYFEAVAFRVGRGITAITTQNIGAAYPETASLATTGIDRLATNLGTG